jgi:quercetin dioxygenase-like cupin family protein
VPEGQGTHDWLKEEQDMKTIDTQAREEGETTGTARRPKQHLAEAELSYELGEESVTLIAEARSVSDGRAAKTLSKHPGLNTVLTALRQGTVVRRHQTPAPVLIQVVSGTIRLELPDKSIDLQPMGFIILAENLAHQVEAVTDASFVIAIAAPKRSIRNVKPGPPSIWID